MGGRLEPVTQSGEGAPVALSPETTLSLCVAPSLWLGGVFGSPRFP